MESVSEKGDDMHIVFGARVVDSEGKAVGTRSFPGITLARAVQATREDVDRRGMAQLVGPLTAAGTR